MRIPRLGCRTFLKLLKTHSPEQLFSESKVALLALGLHESIVQSLLNPDWSRVEADLLWLEQTPQCHVLTIEHPLYPAQLLEISNPPPLLFVRGKPEILRLPQVAIVGSRNPSAQGMETGFQFAKALSEKGLVITSGLALGIDAASHQGALAAKGLTIAVTGTSLDRVYPSKHKDLATQIVQTGALVSEFPPNTVAKASNFPQRNRIISGLCRGLLVVEAAKDSGSLITARFALEQNREVFAIPGSIHNPLARGCNALIREGAKLVETTQDILEELNYKIQIDKKSSSTSTQSTLDLEQQTLLNLVQFSPTSIDNLVELTGKSTDILVSGLLILELQGYLAATASGCYTRIK
ncbi:MAG: DNA-processing protein DprA [Methylococcaceae bacterium]